MSTPRKEQFSGCLLGECLADALGFPVEGYPPEVCRRYVRDVLRAGHAGRFTRAGFPFGQYTDDSQLARELMLSYVEQGRFEPEDYARRIAAIFEEGRIVGRGAATENAAERLFQGVPWNRAGTPSPSAGNGSAMRAGPVGLFCYDDSERLIEVATTQGVITHRDPRCGAGAVAIAGAVALALRGGPIDPAAFLNELAGWVDCVEDSLAEYVLKLNEWLALPPDEAAAPIAGAGKEPDYVDGWAGISPFVVGSVLWSLYAFLRTPEDYWETICTAIAVGGDVDTTAAMAGAISGARVGLGKLPAPLVHRVTDQGAWGYDELVALAERCYGLVMAQYKELK